ncbi:alkaline phosphatase family protein [Halosimplex carlsbadense]|uniref:hypothetical protein n=1 Tax=Halosimplex carlsbadense TaxID=171164 RepID=UPI001269656C|nr:hypothetical protein [Halosimplex carlsbadense]
MVDTGSVKFALRYPKVAAAQVWKMRQEKQDPAYDPDGVYIHDEDWDIMIILDACRYDTFAEHSTLDGELARKRSRGSTSEEWIRGNFSEEEHGDLVVVATNPFYKDLAGEIDLKVHHFEWVEPDDYGKELTDPDRVTERVLEMAEKYPNKRILAHYMQPHAPYIGSVGEKVPFEREPLHQAIVRGGVEQDVVRGAYRENLEIVQKSIRPIVSGEYGKVVITADHGELLGERILHSVPLTSYYGHPYGCDHEATRMVPWLEVPCETSDRRTVRDEEATGIHSEDVSDQLEALGYL